MTLFAKLAGWLLPEEVKKGKKVLCPFSAVAELKKSLKSFVTLGQKGREKEGEKAIALALEVSDCDGTPFELVPKPSFIRLKACAGSRVVINQFY